MDKRKQRKQRDPLNKDDYFMAVAMVTAAMSRNPHEQNAAVVLSANSKDWVTGTDTMPAILHEVSPWDEEFVIPGEIQALQAINPNGGTMYTTRTPPTSVVCMSIHMGIKRIVYLPTTPVPEKVTELTKLVYVPCEEFKGDTNWLRDYIKSMDCRGLFG
jgi:deoxycytidylate deaminase